jgi:hypothetical protein
MYSLELINKHECYEVRLILKLDFLKNTKSLTGWKCQTLRTPKKDNAQNELHKLLQQAKKSPAIPWQGVNQKAVT